MKALALLIVVGLWAGLGSKASAATFDELAAQAAAARDANNVPQALDLYRQALQLKPDWPEGWWFLGTLAYDADQYAVGRDAFAKFVQLQDQAAPGWSFLGLCEFETGDYAHSLEHIRLGLKLGSGTLEPALAKVLQFHEAILLVKQGMFDQAIPLFLAMAKQGVKDPAFITGIGLAALRRPLLPQEVPAIDQELIAATGRTTYFWMTGDNASADPAFRALVATYPTSPNVHYLYGTYLLGAQPDQALAEFKTELALNSHNPDARAMISLLLIRMAHDDLALPLAQQAVEDGPSTPMAHYVDGLLLTRKGQLQQGIEHLESAQKLDPNNLEYHLALASAYSRAGRNEDARRERFISIALAKE